jgi:hypothetical protein
VRLIPAASESYSQCEIRKSDLFIGEIIDLGYRSEKEDKVITLPPPDSIMTLSDAIPDRIIRKITPMLICEKNGKRIYDAGENVSALVKLTVNADIGERYVLRFGEFLNCDGELNFTSSGSNKNPRSKFKDWLSTYLKTRCFYAKIKEKHLWSTENEYSRGIT